MLRNADGGGRVSSFPEKKCYEGVTFNFISVTKGWVGIQFPSKKSYVTLNTPPTGHLVTRLSVQLAAQFIDRQLIIALRVFCL